MIFKVSRYAFFDCSALENIYFGNGVTNIGKSAFSFCDSLNSVYISDMGAWCAINFKDIDEEKLTLIMKRAEKINRLFLNKQFRIQKSDRYLRIMELINSSHRIEIPMNNDKVYLIGNGFRYYNRYLKELPTAIDSCRPDYLLYKIDEENNMTKANIIQFYSRDGKRLPLIQDYHRAIKGSKWNLVIDEKF
jgi:hypothetical protein